MQKNGKANVRERKVHDGYGPRSERSKSPSPSPSCIKHVAATKQAKTKIVVGFFPKYGSYHSSFIVVESRRRRHHHQWMDNSISIYVDLCSLNGGKGLRYCGVLTTGENEQKKNVGGGGGEGAGCLAKLTRHEELDDLE